jgi:hypothetical protein
MKSKTHTILFVLLIVFVITLPFNSIYDTISFNNGTLEDKTVARTPYFHKMFKDILLLGSIFLVAYSGGMRMIKRSLLNYYIFLAVVFLFALFAITSENALGVALGVRSYLTVFFIFLGFYFNDFDIQRLYPTMRIVFYGELMMQAYQLFYAPSYYGTEVMGLNMTNPGTFLIPSTMASYALLMHYYASQREDKLVVMLSVVSVFLARSSTAWIILIIYYLMVLSKKFRLSNQVVAVILLISGVIIFANLDSVTGRDNILANLETRLDIFLHHLQYPLGAGFGLGSGASVLINVDNSVIADSTINSLFINFGWAGMFIYLYFIFASIQVFEYRNLLWLSFIGFSITMIVFEMTPFIQIYFFEWGKMLYKRQTVNQALTS